MNSSVANLLLLLTAAGGLAVALVLARRRDAQRRKQISTLFPSPDSGQATEHRGRRFVYSKGQGSSRASIWLPGTVSDEKLQVSSRELLSRFAAAIGFAPIIPSGDDAFDDAVLVVTDPDASPRLLRDAELRRRLAALVEIGSLQLDKSGLTFTFSGPPKEGRKAEAIPPALDRLVDVAESLESAGFATVPAEMRTSPGRSAVASVKLVMIFVGLGVFGLSMFNASLLTRSALFRSLRDTLVWGGIPGLLALIAWARRISGRPDSHRRLLRAFSYGFIFGGLALWACLLSLDRWVDQSAPRRVDSLLLDVRQDKSSWNARLLRLDGSDVSESVTVSSNFAAAARPGTSHVSIDITTGWLGYDRIAGVRLRKEEPNTDGGPATSAASGLAAAPGGSSGASWAARAGTLALFLALPALLGLVAWRRRIKAARGAGARPGWTAVAGQHDALSSRSSDGWLRLGPAPAPVILNVTPHSGWSRLASRLGWLRPIRSGDSDFDEKVCVYASPIEAGELLVALPEARQLLTRMLQGQRPVVRLDEDDLRAGYRPRYELHSPLDDLVRLHRVIERCLASAPASPALWPRNTQLVLKVLAFVVVFVPLFHLIFVFCAQPEWMALPMLGVLASWALAVNMVTLAAMLGIMRWRKLSAENAAAVFALVPCLLLFPAMSTLALVDRSLDSSPSTVVHARLLEFDQGGAAIFKDWEGHPGTTRVVLAPPGCTALTPPCDVGIRVRRGELGYEYVVSVEAAAR